MKILIVAKQVEVTDDLRKLFDKKLAKFDKFFGADNEAVIALKKKRNGEKLELTITMNSTIFRAEELAPTFQIALDQSMDSIERQIKNKTRLQKCLRVDSFEQAVEDMDVVAEEEQEFNIRVKEFPFKPMSPEEAILQMNLLNHEFYVFINEATGKTNVVYKRHENKYGLIEPKE